MVELQTNTGNHCENEQVSADIMQHDMAEIHTCTTILKDDRNNCMLIRPKEMTGLSRTEHIAGEEWLLPNKKNKYDARQTYFMVKQPPWKLIKQTTHPFNTSHTNMHEHVKSKKTDTQHPTMPQQETNQNKVGGIRGSSSITLKCFEMICKAFHWIELTLKRSEPNLKRIELIWIWIELIIIQCVRFENKRRWNIFELFEYTCKEFKYNQISAFSFRDGSSRANRSRAKPPG